MADDEVELTAQEKRNQKRNQHVNQLFRHERSKALEKTMRSAEVSGKRLEHLAFEARSFAVFLVFFVLSVVYSVPGIEGLAIVDGTQAALIFQALPASVSSIERNFTSIDSFTLLQSYLENTLYNAVYSSTDSGYLTTYNFVLGGVRIRQLRVIDESNCEFTYALKSSSGAGWNCKPSWAYGNEQTASFNGYSWSSADQNQNTVFGVDAKLLSLRTGVAYPGSGYVVDLGTDRTAALATIQALSTNNYYDETLTAAVIVEFSTYNPTTYLHQTVQLLFERTSAGALLPSASLRLTRIYRYPTESRQRMISFLLDVINTIYILYFVFAELKLMVHPNIREILAEDDEDDGDLKPINLTDDSLRFPPEPYWKRPLLYFLKLTEGWEVLHLCNIAVFLTVLVLNLRWYLNSAVYSYSVQPTNTAFQNLAPLAQYSEVQRQVNAFNVLFSFFKLFKFCKLHSNLNVIWLTLTESVLFLFGYVIILFVVMFGLSALAYTVFGDTLIQYSKFDSAFGSLLSSLQNSIDFDQLAERSTFVAAVFFFLFLFLIFFVLLNLFIAILNKSFKDVVKALDMRRENTAMPKANLWVIVFGECSVRLWNKAMRRLDKCLHPPAEDEEPLVEPEPPGEPEEPGSTGVARPAPELEMVSVSELRASMVRQGVKSDEPEEARYRSVETRM